MEKRKERSLKVLVLEDVDEDLELIQRALKKAGFQFQTKRVDTREEFLDALNDYHADVILSDHSLPQFNSAEALQLCRTIGLKTPFILVTGTVSEEFAVNCLEQGADNYVLKTNLARLPSAIQNALQQREAEQEKLKATEALQLQNEELKKINRELDSVSHNLKAPLMSVLGLLNLAKMEDEKRDNAFQEYFRMMERSIHKLDDTLKEILDYSRNARKDLLIEPVDLQQIIYENFERMEYMPGAKNVRKEVLITGDVPFYSDAYRLSVIFNNLISNSIKYADPCKEQSFIEIHAAITPEKAIIDVEDNGIGIAPDYINRVFDMFFRATLQNEGAGLGLYIVKETVEKLKGDIRIDSELGKGTRFHLELVNYQS
jgi:signal transduction histidine kinase